MQTILPFSNHTTIPTSPPNVGILLLNLGGPNCQADVEPFLYNLFSDPGIIRLPTYLSFFQNILAWSISKLRSSKARAAYQRIGGGSPLLNYTVAQAEGLTLSLWHRHQLHVRTYIGMRYWHPFTEDTLTQLQHDDIHALVILPLYPHYSVSTTGSSLRILKEEFQKPYYDRLSHTFIVHWYTRPTYLRTLAQLIHQQLQAYTPKELTLGRLSHKDHISLHVLFSAHGVPKSYVTAGDPYQQQMEHCVSLLIQQLPKDINVHLSYQSRVGPVEWLTPYTDNVIPQLGREGVKNLVVVPISFVSDHIETLEEIDMEYKELAEEYGIVHWKRCPALNVEESFIDDLGDMVAETLKKECVSIESISTPG